MMSGDEQVRRAIEIGEKNKRTIELIKNWCAYIVVKQSGGVGIVEIETGLPIGTRSLECPHARAAGWAGMDMAHIAVDFYDRNCVDCQFRKPVTLPNLSVLVAERDAYRARQEQAQQRAEQAVAERLSAQGIGSAELTAWS